MQMAQGVTGATVLHQGAWAPLLELWGLEGGDASLPESSWLVLAPWGYSWTWDLVPRGYCHTPHSCAILKITWNHSLGKA